METRSVVLYQNDPRTAQTLAVSLSQHFDSVYLAGKYEDVRPAVARHRAGALVLDLETSGAGEVERLLSSPAFASSVPTGWRTTNYGPRR